MHAVQPAPWFRFIRTVAEAAEATGPEVQVAHATSVPAISAAAVKPHAECDRRIQWAYSMTELAKTLNKFWAAPATGLDATGLDVPATGLGVTDVAVLVDAVEPVAVLAAGDSESSEDAGSANGFAHTREQGRSCPTTLDRRLLSGRLGRR